MPFTYQQFKLVRDHNPNRYPMADMANNMRMIMEAIDDKSLTRYQPSSKAKLKEMFAPYNTAIQTILKQDVSEDEYNASIETLSGLSDVLKTNIDGETVVERLAEIAKYKMVFFSSDDLYEQFGAFGKLINCDLKSVPQIRGIQSRLQDVDPTKIAEQSGAQKEPGKQDEIKEENAVKPEEQVNPQGAPQDVPPQVDPQDVEVPGPLSAENVKEPAKRLMVSFQHTAEKSLANVVADSKSNSYQMQQNFKKYADAISKLSLPTLKQKDIPEAKEALRNMKEIFLLRNSKGSLGYDALRHACKKIDGGCTQDSLKGDLDALNNALNLGLETLENDLKQSQEEFAKLTGRPFSDTKANVKSTSEVGAFDKNPDQRDPLEHLNCLYETLNEYDTNHMTPQFTALLRTLKELQGALASSGKNTKNVENLLQYGTVGKNMLEAAKKLQDDDQTIQGNFDKKAAREQLALAAAALGIKHEAIVSPETFQHVQDLEKAAREKIQEQRKKEQERQTIHQERFGESTNNDTLDDALAEAVRRVNTLAGKTPRQQENALVGLCTLIAMGEDFYNNPGYGAFKSGEAEKIANSLSESKDFLNLLRNNKAELLTAAGQTIPDSVLALLSQKQLEMEHLPELIPNGLRPTALKLTEHRIGRAIQPDFQNEPLDKKLHTLAEILAARDVVASTRGDKDTLEKHVTGRFFARTHELENCQTFKNFVKTNEAQVLRSLRGRTHGGAMEDLFKSYLIKQHQIPDDIPTRFMPTGLERIDNLKKIIKSADFQAMNDAQKKNIYGELLATRLAVGSIRNQKSSLNFPLKGEELAKARDLIMGDPDMMKALGDPEMRKAALTGHGGRMEDIVAKYNCTDPLKTDLPERYRPTLKQMIQHDLGVMTNAGANVTPEAREKAAARILVTLEQFGNKLDYRVGQAGPSIQELNDRAKALSNDRSFKNIISSSVGDLQALGAQRNPLQSLRDRFAAGLQNAQTKPLRGSFTRLSPAQPPRLRTLNLNKNLDVEKELQKSKEMMKRLAGDQNALNSLNSRTVRRAVANVYACHLAITNDPKRVITASNLEDVSTGLLENKEWRNFFDQKNPTELANIIKNANSTKDVFKQVNEGLLEANPKEIKVSQNEAQKNLQVDLNVNNNHPQRGPQAGGPQA